MRDRFDFTKRKAYYLIDAFEVVLINSHLLMAEPSRIRQPVTERNTYIIRKKYYFSNNKLAQKDSIAIRIS